MVIEAFNSAGAPNSVPSGFTADVTAVEGTTDGRGRTYYGKFQDVGAGPYSFGWASPEEGLAVTLAVRGARQTSTPLSVTSTTFNDTTSATTWTTTAITPAENGCCVIGIGGASPNGNGRTYAITSGTTQRLSVKTVSENHVLVVGTLDQSSAAAVTTAGTISTADIVYGIQMAFAPAAPIQKRSRRVSNPVGLAAGGAYR
ncbi:MAG: hypothetical protein AB7U07_01195 [Thermoleophilia bacterium]